MNTKFLSLVAIATLLLIARSLATPKAQPEQARATSTPLAEESQTDEQQPPMVVTDYRIRANTAFESGVKGAIFARSSYLFARAQRERNAAVWLANYCDQVAEDIVALRWSVATPTGEPSQFDRTLNRSAELSACWFAQHWIESGTFDPTKGGVDLNPIIEQYQQGVENEQPAG